ncbi:hypothetical protein [Salipiger abyssi]|uniref:Uncharacterized protein n=1 Tax=Salipiger abyssi TaxID=1250539 RepID=A0A1P8UXM9_9RHOB|nr:hypothetical protein [Salipiger abyssi]APZ54152.1 hypothetical protein Ga0080574_TMP3818 [Salipiger abyssi]
MAECFEGEFARAVAHIEGSEDPWTALRDILAERGRRNEELGGDDAFIALIVALVLQINLPVTGGSRR